MPVSHELLKAGAHEEINDWILIDDGEAPFGGCQNILGNRNNRKLEISSSKNESISEK